VATVVRDSGYRPAEVLRYLGWDYAEALRADAFPPSALESAESGLGHNAEDPLHHVVRWWDVHRTRLRLTRDKLRTEIVSLRTAGYTEEQVASITGLSRSMVRRRFEATLLEILDELGVAYDPSRLDRPGVCGHYVRIPRAPHNLCGKPTARLAAIYRERWMCAGRRLDQQGQLAQAWYDGHGELRLYRPPLDRKATVGRAFHVIVTNGEPQAHVPFPEGDMPDGDHKLAVWVADTQAAAEGERTPDRSLFAVRGGSRLVVPEAPTHRCGEHLAPWLQVRVLRTR
jgi:AraC-like DNA-binding protein